MQGGMRRQEASPQSMPRACSKQAEGAVLALLSSCCNLEGAADASVNAIIFSQVKSRMALTDRILEGFPSREGRHLQRRRRKHGIGRGCFPVDCHHPYSGGSAAARLGTASHCHQFGHHHQNQQAATQQPRHPRTHHSGGDLQLLPGLGVATQPRRPCPRLKHTKARDGDLGACSGSSGGEHTYGGRQSARR